MVTVETGRTADVNAVTDLWIALAEGQQTFGSHLLTEENREIVRDAIAQNAISGELLIARDSDDVVGFLTFGIESGTYAQDAIRGVVQNIYVEPDARSEGIGSELLTEAERRLAERGAEVVTLEVMAGNDAARRFYRRHGYGPHRVELEKSVESDTLTKE